MKLDHSLVGKTLEDNLLIEELLGAGGMGVTYRACQKTLMRDLCVKFLLPQYVTDPNTFARFKREALVLTSLKHPGIVQCYFYGQADRIFPYFAMEYVRGSTLRSVIETANRRLNWQQVCDVMAQACAALGHAHSQGFVHRDVKPENIMIVEGTQNQIKLLDFGLAGIVGSNRGDLTETGLIVGSVPYMAPETFNGASEREQVDRQVDIYALGCIFYELLTGELAFNGFDLTEIMAKHVNQRVPPLPDDCAPDTVRRSLNEIIKCATEKNKEARFNSCQEILNAIQRALSIPETTLPESPEGHLNIFGNEKSVRTTQKKNRIPTAAVAALLVAGSIGLGLLALSMTNSRAQGVIIIAQQWISSDRKSRKAAADKLQGIGQGELVASLYSPSKWPPWRHQTIATTLRGLWRRWLHNEFP